MRLISSFCALACVSALPLAAVAQTAAETPAPETAPETAGRTVLDVTASGTLTGLAADALGPDAALTVRLHGPVAFDVDTADFASLEIFADDPAVKLTVSDTAAYARITAVSILKANAASGEPAAATFTAAAASAGIATLADGGTTTSAAADASIQVTGTMALSEQLGATSDPVVQATFSDGSTLTVDTTAFSSLILVGPETGAATVEVTSDVATATPLKALLPKVDFTQASNVTLRYQGNGNDSTSGAWPTISGENAKIVIDGRLVLANASVTGQALTLSDGATLKVLSALSNDLVSNCQASAVAVMFAEHPQNPTVTISGSGTRFDVPNGVVALARDGGPQVTVSGGAVFSAYKLGNTRNDQPRMTVDGATLCLGKADATDGLLQMEKGVLTLREATLSANGDWAVSDSSAVGSILLDGTVTVRPNGQSIALQKLAAVPDTDANLVIDGAASANEGIAAGGTVKLQGAFSMPVTMKDVTVAGSCTVSGDVTIEGNVTLKVSEAAQPTWLVDGSLIIAEGATLTVQLDTGVTLANPHCLIQAGAISGSIAVTAGEGMESLKPVQVGTSVWVISNGSIRPKNPVSDGMSWSNLLTSEWVTEGGVSVTSPVQITTESSVVLELANGATLTVDESILDSGSVPELALRVTGGGTATIAVNDGCRFPFAKTTVAAGTVRVEGAADLGAVTIADGATLEVTHPFTSVAGSGTLVLDATAGNIEVDPTLRDSIRTRDAKVILRSNTSGFGVTLDYGVTVNASFQAHLVVESGTHKMTYGQGEAARDFSTTGTTANPTIWVKQGATLEFTAKDISGWTGAANHKAVIRVDEGGYLKIWKKATDTFYYRQCLYLEPGADMEIGSGFSSENKFRLMGGADGRSPQIVVPAAEEGSAASSATIHGDNLTLGNDTTNGLAIDVGEGSTLSIKSALTNHAGSPTLAKYGAGVLELQQLGTGFNTPVNVCAGTLDVVATQKFLGTVTLMKGATLKGGTYSTLNLEAGSTLDASAGALTVSGLTLPDTGTVTVKVANDAQPGAPVLRLSSGTADALAAAQFTVAEWDTLRVAASGSDYVLALRMPTDGEASVTVTKPDGGSSLKWSELRWTVGSDTYPSAAAGATNALTLALPEGVTVAVDKTITAKSLTVTVVDGNGDGQVTKPATLLLHDDEDLAGIAETLTVTAPAVLQVPCTGTAQQIETMKLAKVRGSGVLEISGVAGATCSALGLSTEAGKTFEGTLRIAEGVTKSGDWTIPCDVELNGTVSGTLTVPTGKRFGGSGTVTGQLKLENGYILKCGEKAADVPLIGTEVGEETRVFDTSVQVTGGRLWRDTAEEDFILRLAKIDDYDPAFIADSSGYVVDSFTENDVSGLRLAAAFELDLSDLRDPGKTSGTYAWNVADNWLAPGGGNAVPGADAVVRIMVPAGRNVTVVIPPGTTAAVRAIQVIGMTGEAAGEEIGTLRWVEGNMPSGSDDVPSPTTLTSTLTAQEIRMAGPMKITQECNVSVQYKDYWSEGAHIGSGAAHCSVWIKAGEFNTNLLLVANTELRVGGGSLKASVICESLNLQTQIGGTGLLKIDQNGDFTPSYIHGISRQDRLELAGGTFTVPAGGMELSDQIEVSADSTLHFAGTELAKAILSFVDGASRTGFSGSGTLTLTGTGTLNASNAEEDSAYTGHLQFPAGNQVVCNIGQRRPAIGGEPYRIEVVRKTEEADEVRIPLYGVDTFVIPPLSDANATAGVAVVRVEKTESDGNTTISIVPDWVGTVAEIDTSKTPAELVLTPLGYPQLEGGVVPGISGEAAMVLRKLANSGNSNFTVRQTTVTGDSMDFFDAEGVNAALLLFTNVAKKETDGSVTVAYAFGISDITVEGDDIIVTAKVLGPEGAAMPAADFAEAASVDLYRDDTLSTVMLVDNAEVGTRVLKLEGALSTLEADSAATFTVKATSGVEQTPDESVPDEGTDFE